MQFKIILDFINEKYFTEKEFELTQGTFYKDKLLIELFSDFEFDFLKLTLLPTIKNEKFEDELIFVKDEKIENKYNCFYNISEPFTRSSGIKKIIFELVKFNSSNEVSYKISEEIKYKVNFVPYSNCPTVNDSSFYFDLLYIAGKWRKDILSIDSIIGLNDRFSNIISTNLISQNFNEEEFEKIKKEQIEQNLNIEILDKKIFSNSESIQKNKDNIEINKTNININKENIENLQDFNNVFSSIYNIDKLNNENEHKEIKEEAEKLKEKVDKNKKSQEKINKKNDENFIDIEIEQKKQNQDIKKIEEKIEIIELEISKHEFTIVELETFKKEQNEYNLLNDKNLENINELIKENEIKIKKNKNDIKDLKKEIENIKIDIDKKIDKSELNITIPTLDSAKKIRRENLEEIIFKSIKAFNTNLEMQEFIPNDEFVHIAYVIDEEKGYIYDKTNLQWRRLNIIDRIILKAEQIEFDNSLNPDYPLNVQSVLDFQIDKFNKLVTSINVISENIKEEFYTIEQIDNLFEELKKEFELEKKDILELIKLIQDKFDNLPKSFVKTVNNIDFDENGNIEITKNDINLENVDNTSDKEKPISDIQKIENERLENEITVKIEEHNKDEHSHLELFKKVNEKIEKLILEPITEANILIIYERYNILSDNSQELNIAIDEFINELIETKTNLIDKFETLTQIEKENPKNIELIKRFNKTKPGVFLFFNRIPIMKNRYFLIINSSPLTFDFKNKLNYLTFAELKEKIFNPIDFIINQKEYFLPETSYLNFNDNSVDRQETDPLTGVSRKLTIEEVYNKQKNIASSVTSNKNYFSNSVFSSEFVIELIEEKIKKSLEDFVPPTTGIITPPPVIDTSKFVKSVNNILPNSAGNVIIDLIEIINNAIQDNLINLSTIIENAITNNNSTLITQIINSAEVEKSIDGKIKFHNENINSHPSLLLKLEDYIKKNDLLDNKQLIKKEKIKLEAKDIEFKEGISRTNNAEEAFIYLFEKIQNIVQEISTVGIEIDNNKNSNHKIHVVKTKDELEALILDNKILNIGFVIDYLRLDFLKEPKSGLFFYIEDETGDFFWTDASITNTARIPLIEPIVIKKNPAPEEQIYNSNYLDKTFYFLDEYLAFLRFHVDKALINLNQQSTHFFSEFKRVDAKIAGEKIISENLNKETNLNLTNSLKLYAKSVNNVKPDTAGNVTITIPPAPNLSTYTTNSNLAVTLKNYAKSVNNKLPDTNGNITINSEEIQIRTFPKCNVELKLQIGGIPIRIASLVLEAKLNDAKTHVRYSYVSFLTYKRQYQELSVSQLVSIGFNLKVWFEYDGKLILDKTKTSFSMSITPIIGLTAFMNGFHMIYDITSYSTFKMNYNDDYVPDFVREGTRITFSNIFTEREFIALSLMNQPISGVDIGFELTTPIKPLTRDLEFEELQEEQTKKYQAEFEEENKRIEEENKRFEEESKIREEENKVREEEFKKKELEKEKEEIEKNKNLITDFMKSLAINIENENFKEVLNKTIEEFQTKNEEKGE